MILLINLRITQYSSFMGIKLIWSQYEPRKTFLMGPLVICHMLNHSGAIQCTLRRHWWKQSNDTRSISILPQQRPQIIGGLYLNLIGKLQFSPLWVKIPLIVRWYPQNVSLYFQERRHAHRVLLRYVTDQTLITDRMVQFKHLLGSPRNKLFRSGVECLTTRSLITSSVFFVLKFQLWSAPPPILYRFLNISTETVTQQSFIDASTDVQTYVTATSSSYHSIKISTGHSLQPVSQTIPSLLSFTKISFTDIIIGEQVIHSRYSNIYLLSIGNGEWIITVYPQVHALPHGILPLCLTLILDNKRTISPAVHSVHDMSHRM